MAATRLAGCATAYRRGSGAIEAGDVITLGEVRAKGMVMLEVACRRFERRGRLPIERLIAEHSAAVLDLQAVIAADCPRMRNPSTAIYERCGVHLPRAAALVLTPRRARDG